jgi:hypothetical protein
MFTVSLFSIASNVSIWSYTIAPLFGFLQGVSIMHIEQFESFSQRPTLDALDAEFGHEEQCAAGRNRKGGHAHSAFGSTKSEFPRHLRAARQAVDPTTRSSREAVVIRSSLGKRALRTLTRLLILFFVGVGATLGWQSYGNAARAMIANSSTKLGWLAPSPAPAVQTAASAPAATASSDDCNNWRRVESRLDAPKC